jgi:hypothetical protein
VIVIGRGEALENPVKLAPAPDAAVRGDGHDHGDLGALRGGRHRVGDGAGVRAENGEHRVTIDETLGQHAAGIGIALVVVDNNLHRVAGDPAFSVHVLGPEIVALLDVSRRIREAAGERKRGAEVDRLGGEGKAAEAGEGAGANRRSGEAQKLAA